VQAALDCFADTHNDSNKIVLAAPTRPSFADDHDAISKNRLASGNKRGKRSAERRMPTMSALKRGCAPFRGTPAFRRSRLRHSPPAITPMAQPQNRVSRRRTELECFARLAKHAPCGPVLLPVDRGPRAARERMAYPRAGTAPRFRLSGLPFRKGALYDAR
jgi:hypothetical protein